MPLDPYSAMVNRLGSIPPAFRKDETEAFPTWQEKARARLAQLLGLPKRECEPNFRIEWINEEDPSQTEIRFAFESESDITVGCHLLLPKGLKAEKLPLVICLQGHSTGMHISLGHAKFPGDEDTISGGDRDFARQVISRGQAALVLDQRGMGERGGTKNGPACHQYVMQALLLGETLLGGRCHDVSRTIDMILAHFPQIDASRIAIMGNSGGGTTSVYAAALDTRIAAAMPSCAFSGFLPSIGAQYHCACNYVPGIANDFDMGDIAGLIAPRPLVIVNGAEDPIFPVASAREQFAITKNLYAQADASLLLRHVIGSEGHRFYAEIGWKAFDEVTGWKQPE